jgi:NAD(P)-dependent dehydrogenase (short-subunit alcohol dehydrogenase family)
MQISLAGKTVLVTGAESGIGRAIATECAGAGAALALVGLSLEGLAESRRMILDALPAAPSPLVVQADVREPSEIDRAFEHCCSHFGTLDGCVANAGVARPVTPSTQLSLQDWSSIVEVNLTGTFLTLTAAARVLLRKGRGGSLLATGSSTAIRGAPGLLPYIASKAGVHAMVGVLAAEWGPHRIRVNALVPGLTSTPMTLAWPGYIEPLAQQLPLGEMARPEEHARLAVFALSDAAPHMTGSLLKVDAGRTA